MRLRALLCTLVLAALSAVSMPGLAAYPDKPIRLIVPSAPGGAPDALMRALGAQLSQQMGVPIVVDNKPGGSYTIGTMDLVHSAPDGYTLAYGNIVSLATNRSLLPSVPYDVEKDLTLVANTLRLSNLLIVNNDLPVKTVPELVAYAKKNPGKLNYASSGNGTIVQLTAELFKAQAGVFVTHIPYKGTALAIPDLISGKIDVLFDSLPTGMPHVRDGRLRALGVTSLKRSPLAPELPPIAETLPGYESNTWFGFYGPKGLPADIVAKINKAANEALADPEVKEKLARLGIETATPGTPDQFAKMVAADAAKWKKIVVDRKITNE